jgi:anti-sigma B factor antagonist
VELLLSTHQSGRFTVLTVGGEIDLASAPQLSAAFDEIEHSAAKEVVLDLSEVTFLDSTGVGVLINGRRGLGGDGSIRIVSTRSAIIKLFALTGLSDLFPIYPSLEEALV